jgi:hypothetical protein
MPKNRGSANGIPLAPARGPSPGPSPLVPRGEGRIRSRTGEIPRERHWDAERSGLGERHLAGAREAPSPRPPPPLTRERGRIRSRQGKYGARVRTSSLADKGKLGQVPREVNAYLIKAIPRRTTSRLSS